MDPTVGGEMIVTGVEESDGGRTLRVIAAVLAIFVGHKQHLLWLG